ncbi:hypothetical protein BO70DRAFT_14527 [Aspergillus heteromorphus CBS 117.55]|uniref:Uncharacterized protein n=1 Tax=Aspergillus heteromorphus CBS 117.55 TaxID=1448321 RepID=A0A317X215_9EURO|nr:uncharacterized protein BO70DRAFT_14527 [Aspergillus heteromorphus CBS 117.55]PWY92593.1 hypothetical protein BO70DRAFT_14527 [Aspergillus heteromorphus CBS 117.55]
MTRSTILFFLFADIAFLFCVLPLSSFHYLRGFFLPLLLDDIPSVLDRGSISSFLFFFFFFFSFLACPPRPGGHGFKRRAEFLHIPCTLTLIFHSCNFRVLGWGDNLVQKLELLPFFYLFSFPFFSFLFYFSCIDKIQIRVAWGASHYSYFSYFSYYLFPTDRPTDWP